MFLQSGVAGAERMTILYGKVLPKQRYEVKFYPIVKKHAVKNSILDFIPQEYSVNMLYPKNSVHLCYMIYKVIGKEKPDYVFSSVLYLSDKILLFRHSFPETRFIIRCENYWYTFSAQQQRLIRLLYGRADLIVAQTREMKEELAENTKIPSSKVRVLENPIDKSVIDALVQQSANPYPDDGLLHYVAVGRFSYQKGFDLLVDAFAMLHKSNSKVSLYIVGAYDGTGHENYESVREKVAQYGIEDRVHFVGYQSNPYSYLRYADTFVLSSRWEGLPNVLVEAMYLGTPVAAFTCIPFVGRVIENGRNGYCAAKGNVHELADAMQNAGMMGRCTSSYSGVGVEEVEEIFAID